MEWIQDEDEDEDEDEDNRGSLQMGYKRGSSTAQCTNAVQETINHILNGGTNLIMVALDMTMAFDMFCFSILFS